MSSAYNLKALWALKVLKEARHWYEAKFISAEQWGAVQQHYQSKAYHPNLAIRILLFIATSIAMSGVNGLLISMVIEAPDMVKAAFALVAGICALYLAEKALIQNNNHYRSGVVEAITYFSCAYIIGGVGLMTDWNEHLLFVAAILIFLFISVRFLDLICTALATLTLAGFVFYECYEAGGIIRQLIPFLVMGVFAGVYFFVRGLHRNERYSLWDDNLSLTEVLSLVLVYAGGNYFIVREGSIALLNLSLAEGEDIPFAWIFYGFTVLMPLILLYRGVRLRSLLLLRLGVLTLSLSVLTFRYYFSIAPPEIELTVCGVILLGLTTGLYSYLKIPRQGFTREKLLSRATIGSDMAAFAVSQTMGGNVAKPDESFKGGGGSFGGGGASGDF